ncbi:MAG: hypothetical protein AAFX99_27840, partial [Myxococcota bacterium]
MSDANGAGKIVQVMGPVVDVAFEPGHVPEINTALKTTNPNIDDIPDNLVLEVAQHLGENMVRAVAMDSTEGLVRGIAVNNTGSPIMMPVGEEALGRILNVVGQPVDDLKIFTLDDDSTLRATVTKETDSGYEVRERYMDEHDEGEYLQIVHGLAHHVEDTA